MSSRRAPADDIEIVVGAEGHAGLTTDHVHSLRVALVSFYGVEVGTEAWAEAMAVAWERRDAVLAMDNPVGYLFRVGQSKARPHLRWLHRSTTFPGTDRLAGSNDVAMVDLIDALRHLRDEQRSAVLLVKAWGYTYRHAAEVLGITEAAVGNHVNRGLAALRRALAAE